LGTPKKKWDDMIKQRERMDATSYKAQSKKEEEAAMTMPIIDLL
jgi:hypothetical protein